MKKVSKVKKFGVALALTGSVALAQMASAAPDFSSLEAEITSAGTAVAAVASAAIIAGFGIFVLIWGARKIKGALSSGG